MVKVLGNGKKVGKASGEAGESSQEIRARVTSTRDIQMKRFEGRKGMYCNADMQSKDIQAFCKLDSAGEELLKMAITKLGLSARAYDRILRVARTIADLTQAASIRPEHFSETIQYRSAAADWIGICGKVSGDHVPI